MSESKKSGRFLIDTRLFSILLLLAIGPLLAGSWWLFYSYEQAYLDLAGSNLGREADAVYESIINYLQDQFVEIGGITEAPVLREMVLQSNANLQSDPEQTRWTIEKMEADWPELESDDPRLLRLIDNPAARFLRRYINVNSAYREILITDSMGRLVAASGKTTDYFQADEEWWKESYAEGTSGKAFISDIVFDDSAKVYAMELAQPFVDYDFGVIGIIKVVLDAERIQSIILSHGTGAPINAALLFSEGEVFSAPGYDLMDKRIYPSTLEILEAHLRGKRYLITDSPYPAIYGLTQHKFQTVYPRLNWLLITRGDVSQVLGSLSDMRRYFIYLVVAIVLLCLAAVLIVSRIESKPVIEQDPHLEKL